MNSFFFSRPCYASAFQLFKSVFLETHLSDTSFFYVHYYGLTIYSIPQFRPPKFFSATHQRKNSTFRFFRGQRVYFESCLCSKLGYAEFFALSDGKPISGAACRASFAWKFFGQFSSNKPKFFETDSTFPIAHSVFSFDAHFQQL